MNIDKKKLRELAEKSGSKTWMLDCVGAQTSSTYGLVVYDENLPSFPSGKFWQPSPEDVSAWNFIGLANPQTVLALLDEIDRLRSALRLAVEAAKLGLSFAPKTQPEPGLNRS